MIGSGESCVLWERKCADWLGLLGLLVLNQVMWTEARGGVRVGGGRGGTVDQTISCQHRELGCGRSLKVKK